MMFFGRSKKADSIAKKKSEDLELAIATAARLSDIVVRHTQGASPGIDPFAPALPSIFSSLIGAGSAPAVAILRPAEVIAPPVAKASVPAPAYSTPARPGPTQPAAAIQPTATAAMAARPGGATAQPSAGTGGHSFGLACQAVLEKLAARCSDLVWASASTKDGVEIASVGNMDHDKIGVMTGTMQALADGFADAAGLGTCHVIVLDVGSGWVVILSVRGGNGDLVLAGMAGRGVAPGVLLSFCTGACDEIGRLAPRRPQAPS